MSKTLRVILLFCAIFITGITESYAQNNNIKKENTLIRPPYLKSGDMVAIVAPSGVLNHRDKEVKQAMDLLKSWGLQVIVGANVFKKDNHFAGTDKQRAEDFQNALDNPAIKAIWCARGGYGTVRMIDKLSYTKYKANPKWIIGYSDITAIHNQLNIEGSESIHAIMCTSLSEDLVDIEASVESFKNALFGNTMSYTLEGSSFNKLGQVTAPLVGGNLTLLHTMLGSKTSIDTAGKILFIEEIGEYKYHIDRMLQSLKRAGYFENCKGVLVGGMSKMRKNTTLWGSSVEQLILDALAEYDFPIAFNMPAGHDKDNRAIILGRTVELKVEKDKSTLVFED